MNNMETNCNFVFTMMFLRGSHAAEAFALSTLAVFDILLLASYCAMTLPLTCATCWFCSCCKYCNCAHCCVNWFGSILMAYVLPMVFIYLFAGMIPFWIIFAVFLVLIVLLAWALASTCRLC